MKRFLTATVAIGLALSMTTPLAMAQPVPPGPPHPVQPPHPAQVDHTKIVHNNNSVHTTINHTTVVNRPPAPVYNHGPVVGGYHPPAPVGHQQTYGFSGHYWHNGDRYTGNRVVENNWANYHAQRPPGGYEWVHDGSQLVLIGIASGVVASVLANAAYQ